MTQSHRFRFVQLAMPTLLPAPLKSLRVTLIACVVSLNVRSRITSVCLSESCVYDQFGFVYVFHDDHQKIIEFETSGLFCTTFLLV